MMVDQVNAQWLAAAGDPVAELLRDERERRSEERERERDRDPAAAAADDDADAPRRVPDRRASESAGRRLGLGLGLGRRLRRRVFRGRASPPFPRGPPGRSSRRAGKARFPSPARGDAEAYRPRGRPRASPGDRARGAAGARPVPRGYGFDDGALAPPRALGRRREDAAEDAAFAGRTIGFGGGGGGGGVLVGGAARASRSVTDGRGPARSPGTVRRGRVRRGGFGGDVPGFGVEAEGALARAISSGGAIFPGTVRRGFVGTSGPSGAGRCRTPKRAIDAPVGRASRGFGASCSPVLFEARGDGGGRAARAGLRVRPDARRRRLRRLVRGRREVRAEHQARPRRAWAMREFFEARRRRAFGHGGDRDAAFAAEEEWGREGTFPAARLPFREGAATLASPGNYYLADGALVAANHRVDAAGAKIAVPREGLAFETSDRVRGGI